MKIVCEACQAKYSIADDKVRGKVFKIRCKKCSHVIVVRGTGEVASAASGEFASSPSSAPDLALDAGWHIVVDGEQVGPLSEGDIRARLARAEITPDTYIWKEGLADWVKVGTLAEFKGGEAEASNPFATGEAGGPFGDVATQVNAAKVADVLGASASDAAEREAPVPDLFASPAAEAGTGSGHGGYGGGGYGAGDLPAASDQYAASARGGGGNGSSAGGGGLTGQRHENSVLFSLSNLEALAKPGPSSLPVSARGGGGGGGAGPGTSSATTEGSGLIDIRAMANMTLGASAAARNEQRNNELPAFSAPQFSPVAPVLLSPGAGGGTPRWAIGLAVVLGGLLVALSIVGFSLLTRENKPVEVAQPIAPPPPVAPAPVAVAPAASDKAATPPATPPPAANEDLPPREPSKPVAAGSDRGDRPAGARPGARGGGSRRGAASRGGSVAEITDRSPTITPPSRPTEAAPKKPKDDIEALLEAASGGRKPSGGGAPVAARREEEPSGGGGSERAAPLGREDIVKGMNGVMPKGRECFAQYKVPGIANVKVTVAPSGRVTNGVVVGKFAGTPSGSCVESALKSAKFPPSAGLTFDYFIPLK